MLLLCSTEVRHIVDTCFPVEAPPPPAAPDATQGWKLSCAADCSMGAAYQRDLDLSRAYQEWCASSGLELPEPLVQSLNAYALPAHADDAGSNAAGTPTAAPGASANTAYEGKALGVVDARADADGSSASVCLAVWARQLARAQSQAVVVYHRLAVCGWPARAIERELLVLVAALKARLGILQPLPEVHQVVGEFQQWLALAAQRQPLVLVLDGLERLPDKAGCVSSPVLWKWLPARLPRNCRLVLGIGDATRADMGVVADAEPAFGDVPALPGPPEPIRLFNVGGTSLAYLMVQPLTSQQVEGMLHSAAHGAMQGGVSGASKAAEVEASAGGQGNSHGEQLVAAALGALPARNAFNAVVLSLVVRHHPGLLIAEAAPTSTNIGAPDAPGDGGPSAGGGSAALSPTPNPHRLASMRPSSLAPLTPGAGTHEGLVSKGLVCSGVSELMQHVLLHVEKELAAWLPSIKCFWPCVELLATTYMGLGHAGLLQHLTKAAKHASAKGSGRSRQDIKYIRTEMLAVLGALGPYLWTSPTATCLHGGAALELGLFKCKGVPILKRAYRHHHHHHHRHRHQDHNTQHGEDGHEVRHDEVALLEAKEQVSEYVYIASSAEAQATLLEYLADVEVLLLAYHSEYWHDYKGAWARLSQEDGQLGVKLRMSTEEYAEEYRRIIKATDGSVLRDELLSHQICTVHSLLVIGFLCAQGQASEARVLLKHVAAAHDAGPGGRGGSGASMGLEVCIALHVALVDWRSAQDDLSSMAIERLDSALKSVAESRSEREGGGSQAEREAVHIASSGAYWRERAYVALFVHLCTAAGHKLVGRARQEASQLTASLSAFSQYLECVSKARKAPATELAAAEGQWALALVKRDMSMHREAQQHAEQALATVSRHMSAQSRLHVEVKAVVDQLARRLNRKLDARAADGQIGELADLIDLGAADDKRGQDAAEAEQALLDPSLVPASLNEFEILFWQHKYAAACAVARRAVSSLAEHVYEYKDAWVDASLKLSRVLMRIAAFDDAIAHLRSLLQLEMQSGTPPDHMRVVEASIELALHLTEKGSYVEAQAQVDSVLASKLEQRLDAEHPLVCRMHYMHASLLLIQGWLDQALLKLRAAEVGQKARLLPGDSLYTQLFDTQMRIVEAMHAKFEHQAAHQEAAALQHQLEKMFGNNSYEGAVLKLFGGRYLLEQANYKGADTTMRDVTRIAVACLGKARGVIHPVVLSATAAIAQIAQQQARYSEAEHIYQSVIKGLSESDLDLVHSLHVVEINQGFSKLQYPLGRPVHAMQLLTDALNARREVTGLALDALFSSYILVAQQEVELGQLTQARSSLDNIMAIQESTALSTSQEADVNMVKAMLALQHMEDLVHAEGCMRSALTFRQHVLPSNHPMLALHKLGLATILTEQYRIDETQVLIREATAVLSHIFGKTSPHMAAVKRLEAAILVQRALFVEAEVHVKDALANDASQVYCEDLMRSAYQKPVPDELKRPAVLEDLALLATVNHGLGRLQIVKSLLQEVKAVAGDVYGSMQHPLVARTLVQLAKIRVYSGHYVEAHDMLEQGLEQQLAILGSRHPDVILSQLQLVEMLLLIGDADAAMQVCTQLRKMLLGAASPNLLQVRSHTALRLFLAVAATSFAPCASSLSACWALVGADSARRGAHGAPPVRDGPDPPAARRLDTQLHRSRSGRPHGGTSGDASPASSASPCPRNPLTLS